MKNQNLECDGRLNSTEQEAEELSSSPALKGPFGLRGRGSRRPWAPGFALVVALSSPTIAWAQDDSVDPRPVEEESSADPRPAEDDSEAAPAHKMNLAVAPPPAAIQRTDYIHEGFYFRFNVGPGWMYNSVTDKAAGVTLNSNTFAFSADLLVGGSPSPGMAMGGGILTNLGISTKFNNDALAAPAGDGPLFHFIAGPFVDAFPDAKRGFHMGALVGFAGTTTASMSSQYGTPLGGGASFWLGYDMWVAPEWSVGFNIRGTGAYMANSDARSAAASAVFLIDILNH